MQDVLLIGLDLGTQGVRAMLADTKGKVLASSSCRYARINAAEGEGKEQAAYDWEKTAWQVLADLTRQAQERLRDAQVFLAVDGTSGTILPLDRAFQPLRTALM